MSLAPNSTVGSFHSFHVPERGDWVLYVTPSFAIRPPKGEEPNAFHRLMQRLVLGFRWRREA